jgi:hypothetical protein
VRSIERDNSAGWDAKPSALEANHWDDLRLGVRFFAARDAAIDVLNAIEVQMVPLAVPKLTVDDARKFSLVQRTITDLREAAQRFLDEDADPPEGRTAMAFRRECVEADPAAIIRSLVKRDDRVLRLVGKTCCLAQPSPHSFRRKLQKTRVRDQASTMWGGCRFR